MIRNRSNRGRFNRGAGVQLEALEDRKLLSATAWGGFARDAQHSGESSVAAQPLGAIHWQTPLGTSSPAHFGSPLVTAANTVIVAEQNATAGGYDLNAFDGASGAPLWTQTQGEEFVPPDHDWTPSYSPALADLPGGTRLYFPGADGTILYRDALDGPGTQAVGRIAFYGNANYAANPAAFAGVRIGSPLTVDASGNLYFTYRVAGDNPLHLTSGVARIGADGSTSFVPSPAADVLLYRADGTMAAYPPSADNDLARGDALRTALAAAAAGDTVVCGAGTFDVGSTMHLDIPAGVTLEGAGESQTRISSSVPQSADPNATFQLYDGSVAEDLEFHGALTDGNYQTLVGNTSVPATFNASMTLRRCMVTGQSDGIFIWSGNNIHMALYDCDVETTFDTVAILGSSPSGDVVEAWNSTFACSQPFPGTPLGDLNCVNNSSGFFIAHSCTFIAVGDANSVETTGVFCQLNGSAELFDSTFDITAPAGIVYDLINGDGTVGQANSGIILVSGGHGSGPGGAYVTSGAIDFSDPGGGADPGLGGGAGPLSTTGGATTPALDSAPALSNDGSKLYVAMDGVLVEYDSHTLVELAHVPLGLVHVDSSASPTVGPDGDVYFGVLSPSAHLRGSLEHFSADLSTTYVAGSFGWDDTVSIVPASMVPSYTGTSTYLLMTNDNDYAGAQGTGINKLALLDPKATAIDPVTGEAAMATVLSIAGVTADPGFPGNPDAVREWSITSAAVDPATHSIFATSADGWLYRWDTVSNTLVQRIALTGGSGPAYTPTAVGPDGTVYAISDGVLFAVGKSSVTGRTLFYDNSKYDGNSPGPSASDSAAIATDKAAYLPGSGPATFANISSYSKGINGVMIDLQGSHPEITAADFVFRVGNNNAPDSWAIAPPPSSVVVLAGAGANGSDRVELVWADGAIRGEWLQITVKGTDPSGDNVNRTGLASSDVFFFGSAPGDTGVGDSDSVATVSGADRTLVQTHMATVSANIPLTNPYDINRDGQVGGADFTIVQIDQTTNTTGLQKISIAMNNGTAETAPLPSALPSAEPAVGSATFQARSDAFPANVAIACASSIPSNAKSQPPVDPPRRADRVADFETQIRAVAQVFRQFGDENWVEIHPTSSTAPQDPQALDSALSADWALE